MNIALLPGIFFPKPGGVQVQTHNLANKLVDKGHTVHVLLLNKTNIKNNIYKIIVLNKITLSLVFYLKYFFKIDLSLILEIYLKKIIKKYRFDLFHFQFTNFKMLLIINILKKLNQKVIVTFQGADLQINKRINYGYRLNKKYEKTLINTLPKIDLFFSISNNIKKDLNSLKIKNNKIIYIPNGIEIRKFTKFSNTNKSLNKCINLITVARFAESKKGLDLIPAIAKHLINSNIKFKWYLVGKNSKYIKNKIFFNKHTENFRFIENIENLNEKYCPHSTLIKFYKKSHLYINLARIESFGLTIIEGLASNLPVITFDTKGGNELIINNFNGAVVKKYLPLNMSKMIIKYKKNKSLFLKCKKNSILSIRQYNLEMICQKTVIHYKRIINNNF